MERDCAEDNVAELAVPDALDDEQVDTDRRRDLSELDEEHEHDPEQDRIDAVVLQHREDQRHGDDDHAEALDQAAQDRVEHEQREEEFEPAQVEADDEARDLLADAGEADRIGEDVGGQDDEQDVSRELDRVRHRLDQTAQRETARHRAQDDRQRASDGGALGGGDEAEIDAAERAADQNNERKHVGQCDGELAQ